MSRLALIVLCFICFGSNYTAARSTRVVGGDFAIDGQFAHQVSLRKNGSHTCGGSIISRMYILTAAHCVVTSDSQGNEVSYDPSVLTVRVGSTDRFRGGVLMRVAKVIVHGDYGNFLNDVALLLLEEPLIFSENIHPIALASSETPYGSKVIISGWGRVKQGGDIPQKLKWNELTAISRQQCKEEIKSDSDSLICLAHNPGNGACNGDSGGPATYNNKLVGVAGFVYSGCGTKYPDGYAKIFYHRDWIKKHSDI